MRAGAWIALVVLAGAGCGGGGDSSGGMVRDQGTATLQEVQSAVLSPRCAVSACHTGIPAAAAFKSAMGSLFPVFRVSAETVALQAACATAVGLLAGLVPSIRAARVRIVDGLRYIG